MSSCRVAALVCALLLFAGAARAQLAPVGGGISGRVFDAAGDNLEGVEVAVVGERRFRTTTDRWGYRFDHLPPDEYSVEVTAEGFVTTVVESVEIWVGDSLRIDFHLQEGSPNAVSVTSMPIIDTRTAGAAYRLFDPPLGSLPVNGELSGLERLLPQESELVSTTSLTIDGAEVLPSQALDFALWRPTLSRLSGSLFESLDLFGSRVDPRIRTLDSLQLMTKTTVAAGHGTVGVRATNDSVGGDEAPGLAERYRLVRPQAAVLFPVGSRFRLFSGLAAHRARARPRDLGGNFEPEGLSGSTTRRDDDTVFVRLNGGPVGPSLEVRASFLEIASDERTLGEDGGTLSRLEASVRRSVVRMNRFSGRFGVLAQFADRRASTAVDDLETRRIRTRDLSASVDTLLARHFLVLGASRERTDGDLLGPPLGPAGSIGAVDIAETETGLGLERWNLHLSNHWRATPNLAAQVGVRWEQLEWHDTLSASDRGTEDWLLPRLGIAWDVRGDGEWALLLSGGRELVRQVAIYDSGLAPFLERGMAPTDRVEVDAVSLGSRYQLFPGLHLESEIGRRRFAGDRESALRPLAEEEVRLRFGADARISRRWQARGLYELRDLGRVLPGSEQAASAAELGTTQRTHLHLVRSFDSGWVLSGVLEYVDDMNVAMRGLGVVTEVPVDDVQPSASLAQFDLMLEYRWDDLPRLPFFGNEPMELVWRIEVLNVLDRQAAPVAVPDVFVGTGIEGLYPYPTLAAGSLGRSPAGDDLTTATQQLGRRIWLGFGLEI